MENELTDEDIKEAAENVIAQEEMQKRLDWYEKRYGGYFEKRGLHNTKNLFRWPNGYEWLILFMLGMTLFLGWAYAEETKVCRAYVQEVQAQWNELTNGTGFLSLDKVSTTSPLPRLNTKIFDLSLTNKPHETEEDQ